MKRTILFALILSILVSSLKGQSEDPYLFYDSNTKIILDNRANLLIEAGDFENALLTIKELIALDKMNKNPYLRVYQLYTESRAFSEEIMEILNKGKEIFPNLDELYFYSGEIYKHNQNSDAAVSEYSKAIELSQKNGEESYLVPFYYLNCGNLYLASKQFEQAINDYNNLLRLDPYSTAGYTNRGIANHMSGNKESSCKDWEKAVQLGFDDALTYHKRFCY